MNPYPPPRPYPPGQYPPPDAPYGQPPPQGWALPPGPRPEDESHLNTLAVCHYVYAGMMGVFGLFGLIYVAVGAVLATSAATSSGSTSGASGPPPAAIGGLIAAVGIFVLIWLWAQAAAVVYSGVSIKQRRRRVFSFVVACICCMNIPLGATLGIFTLVVLSRASVKALYDRVAYYGA